MPCPWVGGEPDIRVPVPASESPSESEASARVDTADCFEIEDIDDAGWEFVTRPAEPLPNGEISLLRTIHFRRIHSSMFVHSHPICNNANTLRLVPGNEFASCVGWLVG